MKKILTLLSLLLSVAVTAQNVGIGTNSPTQQLDVNGNLRVRNLANSTGQASSMVQVDAEGVLKLAKIDTVRANPTPTQTGTASTGTSATNDYPSAIAVSGNKICVVNYRSNTITLFDVSKGSPVFLGSAIVTPPTSGYYHPSDVAINGHKAYVISELAGALLSLQIFDISGNVPVQLNATAIGECWRIIIRGTKAYITTVSDRLEVHDLSSATPSLLGSASLGDGSRDFVLVGNKAYVINQSANALQVFDVTSDNPAFVTTVNTGFQPWAVTSDGARVYVVNRAGQSIEVFEISGAQPVSVGTTTLPYMPERIQLSGSRALLPRRHHTVRDAAGSPIKTES